MRQREIIGGRPEKRETLEQQQQQILSHDLVIFIDLHLYSIHQRLESVQNCSLPLHLVVQGQSVRIVEIDTGEVLLQSPATHSAAQCNTPTTP